MALMTGRSAGARSPSRRPAAPGEASALERPATRPGRSPIAGLVERPRGRRPATGLAARRRSIAAGELRASPGGHGRAGGSEARVSLMVGPSGSAGRVGRRAEPAEVARRGGSGRSRSRYSPIGHGVLAGRARGGRGARPWSSSSRRPAVATTRRRSLGLGLEVEVEPGADRRRAAPRRGAGRAGRGRPPPAGPAAADQFGERRAG